MVCSSQRRPTPGEHGRMGRGGGQMMRIWNLGEGAWGTAGEMAENRQGGKHGGVCPPPLARREPGGDSHSEKAEGSKQICGISEVSKYLWTLICQPPNRMNCLWLSLGVNLSYTRAVKSHFFLKASFLIYGFLGFQLLCSATSLMWCISMALIEISVNHSFLAKLVRSWHKSSDLLIISKYLCSPVFALMNYDFSLCSEIRSQGFRFWEFNYMGIVWSQPLKLHSCHLINTWNCFLQKASMSQI